MTSALAVQTSSPIFNHCTWSLFSRGFKDQLFDFRRLIMRAIFLCTLLMIFNGIWKAFSSNHATHPSDSVWYLYINEVVAMTSMQLARRMRRDNQQGLLIAQFIRPIPVPVVYGLNALGSSIAMALFLLLTGIPFVYCYTGTIPTSHFGFLLALLMLPLAIIIDTILQSAIGSLNLWFGDAQPIEWVYQKCCFVLGGMIVPLAFYPDILVLIAKCTPCYWIMGGISRFIFGGTSEEMLSTLFFLLLWVILTLLVSWLSFRVATRKLYFSGGIG